MTILEQCRQALQHLRGAKLRAILAMLGVLVGTASVVAMVMGGELATKEALRQFKTLGTELMAVMIQEPETNMPFNSSTKAPPPPLSTLFKVARETPQIERMAPYTQLYFPASFQGNRVDAMTLGVTQDFLSITKPTLKSGRAISLADNDSPYCMIGHAIASQLQKFSRKPLIGASLQIGNQVFIIAGILDEWPENAFIFADLNQAILLPIQKTLTLNRHVSINHIVFRLHPNQDIPLAQKDITERLKRIMGNQSYQFRTAQELIQKMQKQSDIFTIFLGLIGSISLLVGGIGVMNIMLVSIMERKREIGVRLALGATSRDIATLFLVEAIILSLIGGILGVAVGIGIAASIAYFSSWEFTWFGMPIVTGFTVSLAVGLFFGCYPAYSASKLEPMQALRTE